MTIKQIPLNTLALLAVTSVVHAAGVVDQVRITGGKPIEFTWHFGDREFPTQGVQVAAGGSLSFVLRPKTGRLLTLELREFRTAPGQFPAYVVSADGEDIAFRCRQIDEAGFSSAFVDLPDCTTPVTLGIRNLAGYPLCLSEAILYEDIEGTAREAGVMQPMRLGPTAGAFTAERLSEIKAMIPPSDAVVPLVVDATFAIAQWPPEVIRQRLADTIAAAADTGVSVALHLNTWWAGTPFGCDGVGGRWCDPDYQQVTFDTATGEYGLSIPNHWSSVPWLTTRNARLNEFKAKCFRIFGQLVRAEWDAFEARHGASPEQGFPIRTIVMDNEITYWGAGNPGTSFTLQADFNPAVVAAAREQGIVLDPQDGLTNAEMTFLRDSLRQYNREMAAGLLAGMGSGPLWDRVYTHTFMRGWCFDNAIQATEVGVLDNVRMGGEWGEVSSHGVNMLEVHRELGVPVDINCELGGAATAADVANLAYAGGCAELALFNLSDAGVRATMEALGNGWQSLLPEPWRPTVFHEDFEQGDGWRERFTGEGIHIEDLGDRRALAGTRINEKSYARFTVNAQDLIGAAVFDRLCLNLDVRAFLFQQISDDSYLTVRAGVDAESLSDIARFTNMAGRRRIDLTQVVRGQADALIEFEFHPLGLPGWVAVFEVDLEIPWAEETLLATNRSYRADRLRAESSIVARRSEVTFPLRRGELPPEPYVSPAADREETGEARSAVGTSLVFDPYARGFMDWRIAVAENCTITLEDNGVAQEVTGNAIMGGDDLRLTIRGGLVTEIYARRGSALGQVLSFEPATPFRLARLHVEGVDVLPIDGRATVHGRITGRKPASCPLVVGSTDFEAGDIVAVRWNPTRRRIIVAELRPPL